MKRRTPIAIAAATLVLTVGVLSGCEFLVQHIPAPTPGPVPTATSTSTESQQERTMRLDKEAAEKAYNVAAAEADRLAMAGGASKPTKVLTDNTSGFYLKVQMDGLKMLKSHGWRADRAAVSSVTANGGWSPTEIGLTACEDSSRMKLLDTSGHEVNKNRPRMFVQTLTAKKIDGRWKIVDVRSKIVKTFHNEAGCDL